MASLLDSAVKKQVASAFKGRLRKGVLRRAQVTTLDSLGDPTPGTPRDYTFDGIRENIDKKYAALAQIPETDVAILVILGSLPVEPVQGDLIQMPKGGEWYKVRRVMAVDPAGASGRYQCYTVTDGG